MRRNQLIANNIIAVARESELPRVRVVKIITRGTTPLIFAHAYLNILSRTM